MFWKSDETITTDVDSIFSEAYACIQQGMCFDEINDYDNTIQMYERGLNLIKEGEEMKNSKKSGMYKMLMDSKKTVKQRLKAMKKEGPVKKNVEEPHLEKKKLENVAKETELIRQQLDSSFGKSIEAELIYILPDGVQIFTIDGDVTTAPTEPSSMQILRIPTSELKHLESESTSGFDENPFNADAIIQIGPWMYPLIKNKTPILKNEFGAYLVVNPTPESPNMQVAILLSQDIEPRLVKELEETFAEFAVFRTQETPSGLTKDEKLRLSSRMAQSLLRGGQKVAIGIQTKSTRAAARVDEKGEKYRETLVPTDKPVTMSPIVKGGVVYMHKGTKVVANCTQFVIEKLAEAGTTIGQKVASGAQKTFGDKSTGGVVSGTIEVLGGGIASLGVIFMSLENGGKTLGRSIANRTVQNVKLKYGDDASDTTQHAFKAAGHGAMAGIQVLQLAGGPSHIAGRVAGSAGIKMILDLQPERSKANFAVLQPPQQPQVNAVEEGKVEEKENKEVLDDIPEKLVKEKEV